MSKYDCLIITFTSAIILIVVGFIMMLTNMTNESVKIAGGIISGAGIGLLLLSLCFLLFDNCDINNNHNHNIQNENNKKKVIVHYI